MLSNWGHLSAQISASASQERLDTIQVAHPLWRHLHRVACHRIQISAEFLKLKIHIKMKIPVKCFQFVLNEYY